MTLARALKRVAIETLPASWVPPLAARAALLMDELELHLLQVLCRPEGTSIDVGANLGIYTEILRRNSRDVVAVEPHPQLARRLRHAFPTGVRVVEAALSGAPTKSSMHVPIISGREVDTRGSLESSANGPYQTVPIEVSVQTLDLLGVQRVGFIKIDVEGHEHEVVNGGTRVLAVDRPRLLIELEERHRENAVRQMTEQLRLAGYQGYFVSNGELSSIDGYDPARHQIVSKAKGVGARRHAEYANNFIFLANEECGTIVPRVRQCLHRLGGWRRIRNALALSS